jgi:molybdenum cofactor synthesis domain-containing protein
VSCITAKTRYHGPKQHIAVDAALKKFFSGIDFSRTRRPIEFVSLLGAGSRVLANDLSSAIDIPPFVTAEMDGYAIKSADTKGGSTKNPVILQVVGKIYAGHGEQYKVRSGNAVAIATGARLPKGADAVAMIEHTKVQNNAVKIFTEIEKGKHIALRGNDIKYGQTLLKKGTWLTPQDVGLISSAGVSKIPVFKKPRVAVFATGNEITEPGSKLQNSCIFESNRYMISSMVREFGGEVIDFGICKDDRDLILSKLRDALKFDMVVISGGASVGEKDYVPDLINNLGKPGLVVHGIAMKPGSPTGLGIVNDKPIILSPGYPVSSFVAFYVFGRPLLLKMVRTNSGGPFTSKLIAKMADTINVHENFRTYVRVNVIRHDGLYMAEPVSASGAGLLSTLTTSNGMVIVDNGSKLVKGKKVEVILLRNNVVGVS